MLFGGRRPGAEPAVVKRCEPIAQSGLCYNWPSATDIWALGSDPTATMPGPFRERQRRLSPVRYALFSLIGLAPFSSLLSPNPGPAVASLVRPPAAVRAAASHRQAHKAGVAASSRHSPAQTTHVVSYDRYSMMLDGRRVLLFGGEYQFWRTPAPDQWPHVLALMRAAGLNTVTVGVSWQYHSPAPGVYDFSGIRDPGRFLDDAAAAGLYVIPAGSGLQFRVQCLEPARLAAVAGRQSARQQRPRLLRGRRSVVRVRSRLYRVVPARSAHYRSPTVLARHRDRSRAPDRE